MQTFLPYGDPAKCAKVLDTKRLGKQRVETVQIVNSLVGIKAGWANHPAVKMWRGYEPYLVKKYLHAMLKEWNQRGYNSPKCIQHLVKFLKMSEIDKVPVEPPWFSEELFISHQSNLIRKLPDHYKKFFPNVPDNIEYVWPV